MSQLQSRVNCATICKDIIPYGQLLHKHHALECMNNLQSVDNHVGCFFV